MKCPKCNKDSDFNQEENEIVMENCGHTFILEYSGHYDENGNFTEEGFENEKEKTD